MTTKWGNNDQAVEDNEHDERQFFGDYVTRPLDKPSHKSDTAQTPVAPVDANLNISRNPRRKLLSAGFAFRSRNREQIAKYLADQIEIELSHGTLFLLIPVIIIAGVSTYFSLPAEPVVHNIATALVALLIIRVLIFQAGLAPKYALNGLLIFVAAMGLGQLRTAMIATPMLGSEVSTRLTGKIAKIEQRANGSVRYTIDVLKTERPTLRFVPNRIRATSRKPVANVGIGDGLYGYVRLRPPSGPVRPNGYDFAFYNYFAGIGANGFFLGQPQITAIEGEDIRFSLIEYVQKARFWLSNRIHNIDDTAASAVSAALITGDKAAIPEDINEVLRTSGLAHILSISGLHMALVAGTVMISLRAIFAFAPNWAARRPTKKYAAIAGFVAISIYLFLAGASVATQRSFVMLAVMLGALIGDRSAITMRNLAIAAIIVILIKPEAVLGPSFQMSFAATLALIAAYAAWTRHRALKTEWRQTSSLPAAFVRKIIGFLGALSMTSLVAGTATGLFAAYHFQRVAVLGLLGNLLAMPIVSTITMPFAILATLLIPVGLDGYAYRVMNWSVALVIQIATIVSNWAPSGGTGALSSASVAWATAGLIILCLLRTKLKLFGLICLLPAVMFQGAAQSPIIVISEDAKQVAVLLGNGTVQVNRTRPNGFILDQWKAAYNVLDVVKPNDVNSYFKCENKNMCLFSHNIDEVDLRFAYISKVPEEGFDWSYVCRESQIIVAAYSPATNRCTSSKKPSGNSPLFISAQQLALNGSTEIFKSENSRDAEPIFTAKHALGKATRPWQEHRKYSRPARNLGPIVRN